MLSTFIIVIGDETAARFDAIVRAVACIAILRALAECAPVRKITSIWVALVWVAGLHCELLLGLPGGVIHRAETELLVIVR